MAKMPTSQELRSIQKRMLAMLLQAKQDPSRLDELIKLYSLEMEQEDVALVKQELG